MESLQSEKHDIKLSNKYSDMNIFGLIFSVVIVLINVYVQICVHNLSCHNEESYFFLAFFPVFFIPFIILFSTNSKYGTVSFRLFIGAIIIAIISFMTVKLTGDVPMFLGAKGHNLYASRVYLWLIISAFLGILSIILKKR